MKLTITARDFQEILKVIHCMSGRDFEIVFGGSYEHYLDKRQHLGLGEFICYLDSGNLRAILKHSQHKMQDFKDSQQ